MNTGIIKPNENTLKLMLCHLHLFKLAVGFKSKEREYILSPNISQLMEFIVHHGVSF